MANKIPQVSQDPLLPPWNQVNFPTFEQLYVYQAQQILPFFRQAITTAQRPSASVPDMQRAIDAIQRNVTQPLVSGQAPRIFQDEEGNLDPMTLPYEGQQLEYYSVYDVLGWLMTVLGPAPPNATRQNYLAPMCSLFCKWGREVTGALNMPTMASVILVPSSLQTSALLNVDIGTPQEAPPTGAQIGATLPRAPLKSTCRDLRCAQLNTKGQFGLNSKRNPEIPPKSQPPQEFGHCAETYPLIMANLIKQHRTVNVQAIQGIAMVWRYGSQLGTLNNVTVANLMNDGSRVMNPCQNCEYLIGRKLAANLNNFGVPGRREYEDLGPPFASSSAAPPPPTSFTGNTARQNAAPYTIPGRTNAPSQPASRGGLSRFVPRQVQNRLPPARRSNNPSVAPPPPGQAAPNPQGAQGTQTNTRTNPAQEIAGALFGGIMRSSRDANNQQQPGQGGR